MKKLTKRQTEIFEYINTFFHSHGYSPSYRELMHAFGFASVASVFKHMKCLESKGVLQKTDQKWRALQPATDTTTPLREEPQGVHISIIGSLAHGEKIELFAQMQETYAPPSLVKTELSCYGFLIKDNSFHELQIKQGDLIIIEVKESAKPGELIVCTSDDELVSIIDFTKEDDEARKRQNIHGAVIALLRSYEPSSSSSLSGSKSSSA